MYSLKNNIILHGKECRVGAIISENIKNKPINLQTILFEQDVGKDMKIIPLIVPLNFCRRWRDIWIQNLS